MKKFLLPLILSSLPILLIFFLLMAAVSGGGAGTSPDNQPAAPEKILEYKAICSELGVPWEIIFLGDFFHAQQHGQKNIDDKNPLDTALHFLILEEKVEILILIGEESDDEEDEPAPDWVYAETIFFTGKDEILGYIGLSAEQLNDSSPSIIKSMSHEKAQEKSSPDVRYSVNIYVNADLFSVLTNSLGLNNQNANDAMKLFESGYLSQIYFSEDDGEVGAPAIY